MEHFVLGVNMVMGVVFESEFFLLQLISIYFYLSLIFAQQFPKYGIISF